MPEMLLRVARVVVVVVVAVEGGRDSADESGTVVWY